MAWTDSHTHLQYDGVGVAAIERARAARVERMVCIGTDPVTSAAAVAIARDHGPGVWASAGVHPHEAESVVGPDGLVEIRALLDGPDGEHIVAIGECGLDYYYEHSPRAAQRTVFAAHIALAHERDLALVVHTRDAWDDTFAVLETEGVPSRTVLHCFSGGPAEAGRCLALGAWLSFSGIVTFRNASDVRDAARECPLDRLLVETDAPYLAPAPHRGRTNEPAWVPLVGAGVAAAKDLDVGVVEAATWANTEVAFHLG